jgi:hypothetical protein
MKISLIGPVKCRNEDKLFGNRIEKKRPERNSPAAGIA